MYITVNGVRLFYQTAGAGRPLLLLHGNGEDSTIFDQVMAPLSERYQVFALDSRDHGKSEQTGDLSYENMAKDVAAFCEGMQLDKPVLYGFSDGGIVGLLVAAQHPDLLSRLIVSGANFHPDGLKKWFRLSCQIGYFFTRRQRVHMMLTQPQITTQMLGAITCPTLVLAGEHDLIRTAHTTALAKAIPNAALQIIKGENHGSYVVHSPKLLQYIKE